jgi:hypothetical protein
MGIYQQHMISPSEDTFTSAPAAFGVYSNSLPTGYQEEYFTHRDSTEIHNFSPDYATTFDLYIYEQQHRYLGMPETPEMWMSSPQNGYNPSPLDFMKQSHSHILDPSCLDSTLGFPETSGQTISNTSVFTPPATKKTSARTAGQPTNIVANGKIDRKTLKRLRNRVSASRCRIKKKEWINEMEDESNSLLDENRVLLKKISGLENAILRVKSSLPGHQESLA